MTDTKNAINNIQRLETQNQELQSVGQPSSKIMDCQLLALLTVIGFATSMFSNSRDITCSTDTICENRYARNHLVTTDLEPCDTAIIRNLDRYPCSITFDELLQRHRDNGQNTVVDTVPNQNSSITSYEYRVVDSRTSDPIQVTLPMFVTAEIRPHHLLPSNERPRIP